MKDDLVPLKRVLAELGVSRATLWRASQREGFPPARKLMGRVYWRAGDLAAIDQALEAFAGRSAFERERRNASALKSAKKAMAASARKPRRLRAPIDPLLQPDLFGGIAKSAPGGAEPLK